MKKNIILYIIITILIMFLVYLYFYKNKSDVNKTPIVSSGEFSKIKLENYASNSDPLFYTSLYSDNIIENDIKKQEFQFISSDAASKGDVTINKNNDIVINDRHSNIKKTFNNDEFKSIYIPENKNDFTCVYAITYSGKLYVIVVSNPGDIKTAIIQLIDRDYGIVKFTNLKYKTMFGYNSNSVIVVTSNNQIYDPILNIPYDDKMYYVNGEYLVYEDGSIYTNSGLVISNENNEKYYAKYIISVLDNSFKDTNFVIITTDNHLIYVKNSVLHTYSLLVKDIKELEDDNIKIIFENNSVLNLTGVFDTNKFNID